jgi:hypothetical protein
MSLCNHRPIGSPLQRPHHQASSNLKSQIPPHVVAATHANPCHLSMSAATSNQRAARLSQSPSFTKENETRAVGGFVEPEIWKQDICPCSMIFFLFPQPPSKSCDVFSHPSQKSSPTRKTGNREPRSPTKSSTAPTGEVKKQ